MYAMYQPLRVFVLLGGTLMLLGAIPIFRFLYLWMIGDGQGIQSLVIGGVLVMMGFTSVLAGMVADLINFNRQLIEMTLEKVRRIEMGGQPDSRTQTTRRFTRPTVLDQAACDYSTARSISSTLRLPSSSSTSGGRFSRIAATKSSTST